MNWLKQQVFTGLRHDVVLTTACVLALLSAFIVPPSWHYLGYLNGEVLALLFCLMGVVQGLMRCGLFARLSGLLLGHSKNLRWLSAVLVGLCFFSSMLITNDVALIALVPLALSILKNISARRLIITLVLMTAAANLGSMLTPIGNPQNLFIYTHYQLPLGAFMRTVAPSCACAFVLLTLLLLLCPARQLTREPSLAHAPLHHGRMALHLGLFVLCMLCILRLIPYPICLAACTLGFAVFDRPALRGADYTLLATFVAFFIFVGNIAQLPWLTEHLQALINGHEFAAAVLLSQGISNVPATMLLSGFTGNAHALLLGANIGGLGTLIASFASLITYRYYARYSGAQRGFFLLIFTAINLGLLAALLLFVQFCN